MRPSSTARRYAEAAFDVARQDGNVDQWLSDLQYVKGMLERRTIRQYFDEPNVSREEKVQTLPRIFGGLQPHALNLLRILTVKHRMHLLPAIIEELERLIRESRGVAEAMVTVARPIDGSEQQEIAHRLSAMLGRQVEVHTRIEKNIIGGIVVRVGDQLIDASVAGRLDRLRQELAG